MTETFAPHPFDLVLDRHIDAPRDAVVRHWNAEDMKAHEEMGFHPGWNAAADQLEAVAKALAVRSLAA